MNKRVKNNYLKVILIILTVTGFISTENTVADPDKNVEPTEEPTNNQNSVEPNKDVKISKKEQQEKDRLEKKKLLEEKAINYFKDIGMEQNPPSCNKNLLLLFGIQSEFDKPQYSTAEEKKYCRRNEVSCCNYKDIEMTRLTYYKGVSEMRKTLELLEELFIMFKGQAFADNVINHVNESNKNECDYVFEELKIDKQDFINPTKLAEKTDILGSLLVDLEIYVKRQQWFFANTICTLCNPMNHRHFSLGDKTTITTHVSTCTEVLEIKDFEIRVTEIFDSFINPYVNLAHCLNYINNSEDNYDDENKGGVEKPKTVKDELKTDDGLNKTVGDNQNKKTIVEADKVVEEPEKKLLQSQKRILTSFEDGSYPQNLETTNQNLLSQGTTNNLDTVVNQTNLNTLDAKVETVIKKDQNPSVVPQDQLNTQQATKTVVPEDQKTENVQTTSQAPDNNNQNKTLDEKDKPKNEEKANESKPKRPELIKSIDIHDINELKKIVTKCYHDRFNVKNTECMNICKKDFNSFKFPVIFFDKVSEALRIVFKRFTEKDISEYYLNRKEQKFVEVDNDREIKFYLFDKELYEKHKFGEIEWEYKNDDGIAIFGDHMSKKYVNYKSAIVYALTSLVIFVGLF